MIGAASAAAGAGPGPRGSTTQAYQLARAFVGDDAFSLHAAPRHPGGDVALPLLQEALAAGRHVADQVRRAHGQAGRVDEVQVGTQARRDAPAVGQAQVGTRLLPSPSAKWSYRASSAVQPRCRARARKLVVTLGS